jgi:hypothetical protein
MWVTRPWAMGTFPRNHAEQKCEGVCSEVFSRWWSPPLSHANARCQPVMANPVRALRFVHRVPPKARNAFSFSTQERHDLLVWGLPGILYVLSLKQIAILGTCSTQIVYASQKGVQQFPHTDHQTVYKINSPYPQKIPAPPKCLQNAKSPQILIATGTEHGRRGGFGCSWVGVDWS